MMKKGRRHIGLWLILAGAAMLTLAAFVLLLVHAYCTAMSSASSSPPQATTTVTATTTATTTAATRKPTTTKKPTTATTAGWKPNRKGKSLDDSVPLGTYEEIGSKQCDAQLKIIDIIHGEEAEQQLHVQSKDKELVIVRYSLKVSRLEPGNTFSPASFNMILKDGTTASYSSWLTNHYGGYKGWISIDFAAVGTVESSMVFEIPKDQYQAMYYRDGWNDRFVYYAMK